MPMMAGSAGMLGKHMRKLLQTFFSENWIDGRKKYSLTKSLIGKITSLYLRTRIYTLGLHIISSYAISTAAISTAATSTAAISTVYTFNRWPFRPIANSTACNFNRHKFDLFN